MRALYPSFNVTFCGRFNMDNHVLTGYVLVILKCFANSYRNNENNINFEKI